MSATTSAPANFLRRPPPPACRVVPSARSSKLSLSHHPADKKISTKGREFRSTRTVSPISMSIGSSTCAGVESGFPSTIGLNDLLIVGPGVLGRLVAEMWQKEYADSQIFGQTMTTDHHNELKEVGITPLIRGSILPSKFHNVVFCAPPSRNTDYPAEVRLATSSWSGDGCFVFTSSSAVFDCSDNGLCNEDSPVVPIGRSPRTDILLKAENTSLEAGGCVLRLAGLYKEDRGAHMYWLKKGTVDSRPDHLVNLIHYEDAASLLIAIMKKKFKGRIFVGCDNHPLSRQEIMDCVNNSGKFGKEFFGFTGTDDPLGKRMDNSKTRAELEWEPKYSSFAQFLGLTN